MSEKNKHIYSKEELLKLIKEGKNAPVDMDEFDLEALEGLKMLDNYSVLDALNKDIDKVVLAETKKDKQRKAIYYFSAAASLLLVIGLFFFFKNSDSMKSEKVVASNEIEKPKEDNNLLIPKEESPQPQISGAIAKQQSAPKAVATSKDEMDFGIAENKQEEKKSPEKEQIAISKSTQEEPIIVDADTKSGGVVEKESFQHQASKDMSSVISTQSGVTLVEENKAEKVLKSKKVVAASLSQPSMAYQNNDQESAPAEPADSKKAEEKAKSSSFYSNAALKNDVAKNYKEPAFINGDSTFAAYVKQNLKISSATNSGIIVVGFLVNKNGTATNIEILKSLNNCDACSKDVIDFINSIKKWQPAIKNKEAIAAPKKVSIQYN